ncbi:MAG: GGDEF domain-containing protein, partial [Coriobacteriales bacterium]|nr:GGDEF domain-containing protein [Coriobacteriales bacterium]
QCVNESRALANELARGNLDTTITISPGNDIASGLKNLQSTLKHISWQVKQVAKGDYHQKLSFAGSFSESINDMIEQLKERDQALHAEIEINQQVAFYDTLTSSYSRHYGMLTFERWLTEKQSFVVAFVDLDGLKYVNDTLGHTVGDEYILSTAQILTGFGDETIICRLGGDEFMLLIRGLSLEQSRESLEEMRERLAESFDGGYYRSFSYGLVEVDKDNTRSASLLLSIADECMYDDKRGRKKERRAEA